jgi:hypothetical protein
VVELVETTTRVIIRSVCPAVLLRAPLARRCGGSTPPLRTIFRRLSAAESRVSKPRELLCRGVDTIASRSLDRRTRNVRPQFFFIDLKFFFDIQGKSSRRSSISATLFTRDHPWTCFSTR